MGIECRRDLRVPLRTPMRDVRLSILVRRTTPSSGQNIQHLADASSVRHGFAGRRNNTSTLIRQAEGVEVDGEMPVHDHDVSGPGWRSEDRGITSTTSMLPRRQCGQIRKDTPVSVSCWSR